jgi:hypothetical protein
MLLARVNPMSFPEVTLGPKLDGWNLFLDDLRFVFDLLDMLPLHDIYPLTLTNNWMRHCVFIYANSQRMDRRRAQHPWLDTNCTDTIDLEVEPGYVLLDAVAFGVRMLVGRHTTDLTLHGGHVGRLVLGSMRTATVPWAIVDKRPVQCISDAQLFPDAIRTCDRYLTNKRGETRVRTRDAKTRYLYSGAPSVYTDTRQCAELAQEKDRIAKLVTVGTGKHQTTGLRAIALNSCRFERPSALDANVLVARDDNTPLMFLIRTPGEIRTLKLTKCNADLSLRTFIGYRMREQNGTSLETIQMSRFASGLRELDLANTTLVNTDLSVHLICSFMKGLTNLKLSSVHEITDMHMRVILKALGKLESVAVSDCSISSKLFMRRRMETYDLVDDRMASADEAALAFVCDYRKALAYQSPWAKPERQEAQVLRSIVSTGTIYSDLPVDGVFQKSAWMPPNLSTLAILRTPCRAIGMLVASCPNATIVDLGYPEYPRLMLNQHVATLCQTAVGLRSLGLAGCKELTQDALYDISRYALNLRNLDISDNSHMTAAVMSILMTAAEYKPYELKELCARASALERSSKKPQEDGINSLLRLKHLKNLMLGSCPNINWNELNIVLELDMYKHLNVVQFYSDWPYGTKQ